MVIFVKPSSQGSSPVRHLSGTYGSSGFDVLPKEFSRYALVYCKGSSGAVVSSCLFLACPLHLDLLLIGVFFLRPDLRWRNLINIQLCWLGRSFHACMMWWLSPCTKIISEYHREHSPHVASFRSGPLQLLLQVTTIYHPAVSSELIACFRL